MTIARALLQLVDMLPPAIVSKPPLVPPMVNPLVAVFVNVPDSVTEPWLILMAPALFDTLPASVNVPAPLFVRPTPLVIADSIVASAFAVIVGFGPAKQRVPPVSV
jgi:hypothetical protein